MFEHKDDFPKIKKLEKYSKAIEKNYFDFIKLIKGGDFITEESIIDKTLFELDLKSAWIFSTQPSIMEYL